MARGIKTVPPAASNDGATPAQVAQAQAELDKQRQIPVKTGIILPQDLWRQARTLALELSTPGREVTLNQLIIEGLELRLKQGR